MINDFLFRLINDTKSGFGNIPRPSAAVTAYTGNRRAVQEALLVGANTTDRFKAAVVLTLLLRHSMLARYEESVDTRVTYTDEDLTAELLGYGDEITAPPGIAATYAAGDATPSAEIWTATKTPDGKLSVASSMGTEVVAPVFSAVSAVSIPLRLGGITLSVVGVPVTGNRIVVKRSSKYRYSIAAATARLSALGDDVITGIAPKDLVSLLRNGFVLTATTRIVTAAIGVAYADR